MRIGAFFHTPKEVLSLTARKRIFLTLQFSVSHEHIVILRQIFNVEEAAGWRSGFNLRAQGFDNQMKFAK